MRLAVCLTIFFGGIAMCREASAQQITPSDSAAVIRGDNQFAMDLYAQLGREQPGKNLFFSPTSISVALAMTAAGARGPTQSEMAKVLAPRRRPRSRPTPIIISFWSNGTR